MAPSLSVIIPAYNEERRLPPTLLDILDYLTITKRSYELIVVDDGSSDGTREVVTKASHLWTNVRLVGLDRNQGKGSAVRTGMLEAQGERLLFVDADGSTPFRELERLETALDQGADIAIGSRALHSQATSIRTHWHRKAIGRVFNGIVNLLVLPHIADTQCGFKLFTRRAGRFVFSRQTSQGFSFDVEILYIAQRCGLQISEVPINWTNIPGSKVNLILDSTRMLRDTLSFRWRHRAASPSTWTAFQASTPTA